MTEVTITVSTISDDSYPITILDTDRIAEVKKSVEAAEGTPAAEQLLRYHGRELEDLMSCLECGIFFEGAEVAMEPPSIAMLLVGNRGVGKSSCRNKFLNPSVELPEDEKNQSRTPTSPSRVSARLPVHKSPWSKDGSPERNAHPEMLDHVFKPHKMKILKPITQSRSVILKLYEDTPDIPDSIDAADAVAIVFSVTDRASFSGIHM